MIFDNPLLPTFHQHCPVTRFIGNIGITFSVEKNPPEIFNSDQGSQFTSDAFTGVLIENDVMISMDGRGRALDNIFVERLWRTVKYEEVYLKRHDSVQSLLMGLTDCFVFYNEERRHQSLGYKTPDVVYRTAMGGGAKIVDKYGTTETSVPV